MKKKLNPARGRKVGALHGASNTLLIVTLLLIPFLHKPVSRQQGTVRVLFERQREGRVDTPPLIIKVTVKDELVPVGYVTLLLLLFASIRKKENDVLRQNDPEHPGIVMEDEEVIAAWKTVKRLLSEEEGT